MSTEFRLYNHVPSKLFFMVELIQTNSFCLLTEIQILLNEVFVISGIVKSRGKCYQPKPNAEADNTN